jgi:hypothetical protein
MFSHAFQCRPELSVSIDVNLVAIDSPWQCFVNPANHALHSCLWNWSRARKLDHQNLANRVMPILRGPPPQVTPAN